MSYIKADSCLYEPFFYATSKRRRKEHENKLDTAKLWIDPMNQKMFARKIELDIEEGADAIIIKPAAFYLDIIKHVKERYNIAIAAYQVSGEYMMIKSASNMGCIDETKAILESLRSIKRAGADMIITYYALDAAKLLQEGV
jgi:porphobilinogen synthase